MLDVGSKHSSQVASELAEISAHLATFDANDQERSVVDLFRFDRKFWVQRAPRDSYDFLGDNSTDGIGPSFGLSESSGTWIWNTGGTPRFKRWMREFPKNHRPMPYAEYVFPRGLEFPNKNDWRWGNWHTLRASILIEFE